MSRLLMPMGFTAILGGTMTMVGSSPLILLNDLILTSNRALPADHQMETWGCFLSPGGVALVATGIVYFVLAGRFVLPATKVKAAQVVRTLCPIFRISMALKPTLIEIVVPDGVNSSVGCWGDREHLQYSCYRVKTPWRRRHGWSWFHCLRHRDRGRYGVGRYSNEYPYRDPDQ